MTDVKFEVLEVFRPGNDKIRMADLNRAIDVSGIPLEAVICVRFAATEKGVTFALDVIVDATGKTIVDVIRHATAAIEARRMVTI